MPIHDWKKVKAGIFHDFHHAWIEELKRALNALLPPEYYALAEQRTGEFGPDVLTLQSQDASPDINPTPPDDGALLVAPPKVRFTDQAEVDFYQLRQRAVVVRHASDDQVVAVLEVVSPGNKSSVRTFRNFVTKVCSILENKIHILILDVHSPTNQDPNGLHAAIWSELTGNEFEPPTDQPLTLVAYESNTLINAYVEPTACGLELVDMPLYLEPGGYVNVPLQDTYTRAFEALPRRWRSVVEDG